MSAKPEPYAVEIWDGQRLVEIIAATTELAVAFAALEAAHRLRPGQHVVIRQGSSVIASCRTVMEADHKCGIER